jgi:hypothetical protein
MAYGAILIVRDRNGHLRGPRTLPVSPPVQTLRMLTGLLRGPVNVYGAAVRLCRVCGQRHDFFRSAMFSMRTGYNYLGIIRIW